MRLQIICRLLADVQPSSILELGVGMGGVSARLDADRYVAVEPDAESRAVATERLPGKIVVESLEALPADEPFDLVCAFEVLEHIEDHHAVAAEWVERLRPGGHLLLSVPAFSKQYGPWDRAAGHFRRYDEADIEELTAALGLVDTQVVHYGFPVGNLLEQGRHLLAKRSDRMDRPMDEVTADSARQLQPSTRSAKLTELAGRVLSTVQRPLESSGRGTGLILLAKKPEASTQP